MSDYVLTLSEQERTRFQLMASHARRTEVQHWHDAGIVEGATVADVGCGPGAMLAALARVVGPTGRVDGVDSNVEAAVRADAEVSNLPQATVRLGSATSSGLPAGSYDVAMCRHVLLHNQRIEQVIVDHLASLVRPGGAVYLVESFQPGMTVTPPVPELDDLSDRYIELHRRRGNDLRTGTRLGVLLQAAGLEVETYACVAPVFQVPPGMRPGAWAARESLLADGLATPADLERWAEVFAGLDLAHDRPWYFAATFVAIGRRLA